MGVIKEKIINFLRQEKLHCMFGFNYNKTMGKQASSLRKNINLS